MQTRQLQVKSIFLSLCDQEKEIILVKQQIKMITNIKSQIPILMTILTKIKAKINNYILGDSMIKNLKVWEMSKKLKKANLYVRHSAGAEVRCMKDHIKPTLREKPDHIVPLVGTNDLVCDRPPGLIIKSIVDVASSMKN